MKQTMTKNETLHIRVNGTVKANAEATLGELGVSLSEAVNMFLHQVNLTGGLPFDVRKLPAPASVIVNSMEELYAKLEEAEKDIAEGRTFSAEEVFDELRSKYEFLR
ncbi:MAG: type II toxin-antitoxin system RelB/DinJ family antitoxin [Oscillospiraceae bacterium]|nr:type II toxin-antitoxin system RelB/DinJ family antitoxin [Oscillospiraceae bacterium]